eukprot:gene17399-24047_t
METIPEPIRVKLVEGGYDSLNKLPNNENVDRWNRAQNGCGFSIGAVLASRGLYRRATSKFYLQLISRAQSVMGNSYPYFQRELSVLGFNRKAVILQGHHRSGKSVFVAHSILYSIYPFWYRYLFPANGFFLVGDQRSKTATDWFKTQISSDDKEDPIAGLLDLIEKRFTAQRIRRAITSIFPSCPIIFQPQPSVVIIDQAEELIKHHRADFMNTIFTLVKYCKDTPNSVQLVIVVNSQNAVASLEALNGGDLFEVIKCPRPKLDAVERYRSQDYCEKFKKLQYCIGITDDFVSKSRDQAPEQYLDDHIASYIKGHGVTRPVTKDELELLTNPMTTK